MEHNEDDATSNEGSEPREVVNNDRNTQESDLQNVTHTDMDTALGDAYAHDIRPILDAVDELRAAGIGKEFKLPTIVVCGDQSVGKSSVLEQISGVQLPRGSGIVTRCPLELRMRTDSGVKWRGVLTYTDLNNKAQRTVLNSAEQVGPAVKKAQVEITGDNKCISDQVISLLVDSPHVPNLTLIDLPGIARFQQDDTTSSKTIAEQTKRLITSYISREEVIVIIVVPCYTDMETVESLAMTKACDPTFDRTIGVLTFPDMVNPGAEKIILETLNGSGQVQLKKGFTIVKCRTQTELDDNLDLCQAIRAENSFFQNHEHYRDLKEHQYGTATLAKRLGVELLSRIKATLSGLRATLSQKLSETEAAYGECSNNTLETYEMKKHFVTKLIVEFSDKLERSATGETRHPVKEYELVRLWRTVSEDFATVVNKHIEPVLNKESLLKCVQEQRMKELPGFTDEYPIVEAVVRTFFILPITESVMSISKKMLAHIENVVLMMCKDVFGNYKKIAEFVLDMLTRFNLDRYNEAQELLQFLLEMEKDVWTQDDTYKYYRKRHFSDTTPAKADAGAKSKQPQPPPPGEHKAAAMPRLPALMGDMSGNNLALIDAIMSACQAYLKISGQRIMDYAPLMVMQKQMIQLGKQSKIILLQFPCDEQSLNELLMEDEVITQKKSQLIIRMNALKKADTVFRGLDA